MRTMTQTSNGVPERSLRNDLAYNEMTMGVNGSVMNREEKLALRVRNGFCTECEGPPTLIFTVNKNRLNPLWVTKVPRAVAGECAGGICFLCHPDQDPQRRYRTSRHVTDTTGLPGPARRTRPNFQSRQNRSARGQGIVNTVPEEGGSVITASVEPARRPSDTSGVITAAVEPARRPSDTSGVITAAVEPARRPNERESREMRGSREELVSAGASPLVSPGLSPRNSRPRVRQTSFPGVFVPDVMLEAASQPEDNNNNNNSPAANRRVSPAEPPMSPPLGGATRSPRRTREEPSSIPNNNNNHGALRRIEQPLPASSEHSSSRDEDGVGALRDTPTSSRPAMQAREGSMSSQSFSSQQQTSQSSSAFGMASAGVATAPSASSNLSEQEIDGIIDGVDSLIRDMLVIPGNSELLAGIILGTMNEHENIAAVQTYCLRMIWDTCKDDDENKEALMVSGAPNKIMDALQAFPDSPAVQEKGCGAIWSLGVSSSNRVVLIRARACQQIVQAIKSFKSTESLVRTAIGALRTLSPEAEAREVLSTLSAPKLVAECMVSHRACVSVQRDGCAFLSNCAVDIEKQVVKVVPFEELNAVVQAMERHRFELSVMQGACFALKNYTHEETNCRTIRRCTGIDGLMEYASTYEESPSCMENAADILERLQMSRMMDESIEEQAYTELIRFSDSESNKMEVRRRVLELMTDFDWSPRLTTISLEILRKILNDESQRDQLTGSGGLHRVLQSCEQLASDERVCAEGCSVVACLACDSNKHDMLLDAGASTFLFKSLEHKSNVDVINHALQALSLLSNNRRWFQATKENMPLIAEAHASHPTSDAVQISYLSIVSILDT